jgi:nickel-dependent lactate racemase
MKLEFGFGTGVQVVEVPEKNLMGVLMSNDVPKGLMNEEEVVRALENPIGTPRLKDIVKPGEKIAVITGQRLCSRATDLSEILVRARFCII